MTATRQSLTISIVILSWNRRQEVSEALDRLRSVFDGEVVVVDQGSDDGSRELLAQRDDIRLIALEENVGVAEGRNIGNRAAGGDIVLSLDSDASLGPGFSFEALGDLFAGTPQLGAVAFRIVDATQGNEIWPHATPESSARQAFPSTRFAGGGHAIRRSAFIAMGGYDPALFFYWEEMDFSAKLIAGYLEVMYQPEFVVEHRPSDRARVTWHDGRYFYRVRNRIYLIRKYFRGWSRVRELAFIGTAYLVLGWREGLVREAMRGIGSGLRMPIPANVGGLDLDRFYRVWKDLERKNRPGPLSWLRKTRGLIHRETAGEVPVTHDGGR